jgi:hypothetical protein
METTKLPNQLKPILCPGVTFRIFTCNGEQGYEWIEQKARLLHMTADAFAFASLGEKMKAHGFHISPDAFYMTTTLPDFGFMDRPPAIKAL